MGLYARAIGETNGAAPPLVLLHGFGGGDFVWDEVAAGLSGGPPLLVYDLPGHGRSLEAEGIGGAGRMAKAVLADLAGRGIGAIHLAGHSLGGATAALMALKGPGQVLSATLFAPGGFSLAINHPVLDRYSQPADREDLERALETMAAPGHPWSPEVVDRLWAERRKPGAREALRKVFDAMIRPDAEGRLGQGVLPLHEFAGLALPLNLVWGDEDAVLPAPAAAELPGNITYHRWTGCGHMLVDEAPRAVTALLHRVIEGEDRPRQRDSVHAD